jgi:predicted RNA-binding Zn-ribbon protein involved in translation (DUF1610 family)
MKTALEARYIRRAGNAIQREAVSGPPLPLRASPMELRCPNCGSMDLKRVSLAYEEGLSGIKAKSRLRGLSFGDDGPSVFVGTTTTNGIAQTQLSTRLRPPRKWSYIKLVGWLGLALLILLIVYVHIVMVRSAQVSSAPGEVGAAICLGAFAFVCAVVWRHNHLKYPQEFAKWDRSFVCGRCGTVSE